jgi:hypothetical protein
MLLTEALTAACKDGKRTATILQTTCAQNIWMPSVRISTLFKKLFFEERWDAFNKSDSWEYDSEKRVIRKRDNPDCEILVH